MYDIFISYSRENIDKAKLIARSLEQKGFSVWWDRMIPAGKSFDEVIEKAIDSAKCIIILWSSQSIKSSWARTEAEEGRNRGVLIPVLIEDVKIPLAFRNIQAANLMNWDHNPNDPNFISLLKDIRLIVPIGSLEQQQNEKESSSLIKKEEAPNIEVPKNQPLTLPESQNLKMDEPQKKGHPKITPKKDNIKSNDATDEIKPTTTFNKKKVIKMVIPIIAIVAIVIVFNIYKTQNKSITDKPIQQKLMEKDSIESTAWESAKLEGTPSSIKNYLFQYPNGIFTSDANTLLMNIQDSLGWQTAILDNTKEGFENYLKKFPNGKQKVIANEKINELKNLKIGQQFQGGIIFYIDSSGQHGLIAAVHDQSDGITWGNVDIETGAKNTAIGTGKSNTDLIVKKLGIGNYAAKICADLVIDGYDDWYLPSKDELLKLYENKNIVGGFKNKKYFSSSEVKFTGNYNGKAYTNYASHCRDFGTGSGGRYLNNAWYNVRAIRSF